MALTWTMLSHGATSFVTANSVEKATRVELSEPVGEDGKVLEQKAISKETTVRVSGHVVTGGSIPDAGAAQTLCSVAGIITESTVTSDGRTPNQVTIAISKKDSSTITAYA